jgi:copper chaperone CopZ
MSRTRLFRVPNISCGHCVATIEREISGLEGVKAVGGDAEKKLVRVEYDDERTQWDAISAALQGINYPPDE